METCKTNKNHTSATKMVAENFSEHLVCFACLALPCRGTVRALAAACVLRRLLRAKLLCAVGLPCSPLAWAASWAKAAPCTAVAVARRPCLLHELVAS